MKQTLIIKRLPEWKNCLRNMSIYLNEEKIGIIGHDETKEFKLEKGLHQLYIKFDWCKSQTTSFQVKKNETKSFELRVNSTKLLLYYLTIGRNKYLELNETFPPLSES